ncbi:alpha/beta hydrolase [Maricurvus nonylphenolicus]|uniref:alpha/beta hydrolase n=1 Tax=Maricurvus nonylphenolicus TaxID=1008307 RepID=UPI0036F24263
MKIESTEFRSNKTRCAADFYRPDCHHPHPTIVMAHGFAGQRNFRLPAFAERFCAAGFAVLLFDYRSFGDSDGKPRQHINPWRQLEDWRAAISHARQDQQVDPSKIYLWGSSFSGGHVVSIAAEDHTIAGLIAQVPFVSGLALTRTMAPAHALSLSLHGMLDALKALLGLAPVTYPVVAADCKRALLDTDECYPNYRRLSDNDPHWQNAVPARIALQLPFYNPLYNAQKVRCPALILAATEDSLIPYDLVKTMAERIPLGQLITLHADHFKPYFDDDFEINISHQLNFLGQQIQT